ncbi:MAG: hypothetical protein RL217_1771 [Pseudomonadota bacterium]|jgi:uncharacterized YigZ family protein
MSYLRPDATAGFELEVKKSRFIGLAFPAQSREEALAHLAHTQTRFPDARHYCWAYVVGNPDNAASLAASDDGEPSGTAGKPILNVLMHKEIGDIMLIVVRYFGGIKLGAGGLTRAYSQAADGVVQKLSLVRPVTMRIWHFRCAFAHEQYLRHFLSLQQGEILEIHYGQEVEGTLSLPQDIAQADKVLQGQGIELRAQ